MTRKKKGRKIGSEGPAQYKERSLTKDDVAALARKKSNKRKGNQAGSRHSSSEKKGVSQQKQQQDPRIGSKKPIPLVVEATPHPKSNAAKKVRKLSAEQELIQLENDPQLNVLLDRLDQGEKLGAGLQAYVDEKLDRIEILMKQLGLLEEEAKPASKKKASKDEDLLAQFARIDIHKE